MSDCDHDDFENGKCLECGATKRSLNTAWSTNRLVELKIPFVAKNNGAHLIVGNSTDLRERRSWDRQTGKLVIDFWPATGLWKVRGNDEQHRGVRKMLRKIKRVVLDRRRAASSTTRP